MGGGGEVDPVHGISLALRMLRALGIYQEQVAFRIEFCGREFGGHCERLCGGLKGTGCELGDLSGYTVVLPPKWSCCLSNGYIVEEGWREPGHGAWHLEDNRNVHPTYLGELVELGEYRGTLRRLAPRVLDAKSSVPRSRLKSNFYDLLLFHNNIMKILEKLLII